MKAILQNRQPVMLIKKTAIPALRVQSLMEKINPIQEWSRLLEVVEIFALSVLIVMRRAV